MKSLVRFFLADYGMLFVLLGLCVLFSWLTFREQSPEGAAAGRAVAEDILDDFGSEARVFVAARQTAKDDAFVSELETRLTEAGARIEMTIQGQPADARGALEELASENITLDAVATVEAASQWAVFDDMPTRYPALGSPVVVAAKTRYWPTFLTRDNLLNIADQIAVIAIIAIGMTLVILTAGIDLSVGSLVALSAVLATWLIRQLGGGWDAGPVAMVLCCALAILVAAIMGAFSGAMVTAFSVPPFIATLAMMQIASGLAYKLADNQSIYQLPDSFGWLGVGTGPLGLPNAVILMLALYIGAHFLMKNTLLGRYIYAVGGNPEAAFLSGVPTKRVLLSAYTICGAFAGLGGVVLASQLKSGSPTYGLMYELNVIAAVVVGGTSLFGGRGKIFGTLIGVFIIAVIGNGMNLLGLGSNEQKVVLGGVILGAVLLDRLKVWVLAKESANR